MEKIVRVIHKVGVVDKPGVVIRPINVDDKLIEIQFWVVEVAVRVEISRFFFRQILLMWC